MGTRTKCPVCNGFGTTDLDGYCKRHVPNIEVPKDKSDEDKHVGDDYRGYFSDRPFFPEKFGIIKDKFGCER